MSTKLGKLMNAYADRNGAQNDTKVPFELIDVSAGQDKASVRLKGL